MALITAKLFGSAMEKMKQPSVIGEILAGIILAGVFGFISADHWIWQSSFQSVIPDFTAANIAFYEMAQVGVILLLFTSGMHVNTENIKRTGKASTFTAIGGVILPFTLGVILGMLLDFPPMASLAAGAIFTATSVGVTARTMMDMDLMRTDVAITILTAAVIDDIIVIILLSIILAGGEGGGTIEGLLLGILVFFVIYIFVVLRKSEKIINFGERVGGPKSIVTVALFLCFVLSAVAEIVSLAAITGAFLAGLMVSKAKSSRFIADDVNTIARLFFIPIFFVSVGTQVDIRSFLTTGPIVLLFIPLAIFGKVFGCAIGASIGGFGTGEALKVGMGMIPKMEIA
ncbi:MAG: cation:proton antiporter, partial [Candidatus Thermoplasmatota archaeon]|nr:cation:proton antiporter [Candidatus Thermoplasmatota archaeon]